MGAKTPEYWMARAIRLSRKGFPAPNPHVGCVIVKNGEIVGEGYHDHAGGPHAEAVALAMAGAKAKDADIYVTLEPCNHFGRTPPCSTALIDARVKKVCYAVSDPNPRAQGGAAALKAAGIVVEAGLLADEAAKANEVFLAAIRLQRPFVTLKAAVSLDGKIALPNGDSKWLTGEKARREAHRLRAQMGAVLVGSGTVLKDNPQLTARVPRVVNQPLRIVLDPDGITPADALVYKGHGDFYRFVAHKERNGDITLPAGAKGFDLPRVLAELWALGIRSLLVEGGGKTLGSFLAAGLYERLDLFVAPIVLGQGLSWVGDYSTYHLPQAAEFHLAHCRRLGPDQWMSYRRKNS